MVTAMYHAVQQLCQSEYAEIPQQENESANSRFSLRVLTAGGLFHRNIEFTK
jgi:hypothetical protein